MKKALVILFPVIFSGSFISVNNHVLDVWINPADNMKFVWVPPGRISVEEPVELEDSTVYKAKEIIFPNGFWLGQTEVTVKQFSKFVKKTGYATDAEKAGDKFTWKNPGIKQSGNHPVIFVSYSDVEAYTKWAGVEIPYESEWIYACKAGTETKFYWGDEFDYDYVWCRENAVTGTKPVAKKPPNPYGLYDMVGNAWEYIRVCDSIVALRGGSWTRCNTAKAWWGPIYSDVIAGTIKPTLSKCKETIFQPYNRDDDRGFRCIKRGTVITDGFKFKSNDDDRK
jgi:formylglycine-generating enzyme required for sulfatase activity